MPMPGRRPKQKRTLYRLTAEDRRAMRFFPEHILREITEIKKHFDILSVSVGRGDVSSLARIQRLFTIVMERLASPAVVPWRGIYTRLSGYIILMQATCDPYYSTNLPRQYERFGVVWEIFEKSNDAFGRAQIRHAFAIYYSLTGNAEKSIEYLLEGINILEDGDLAEEELYGTLLRTASTISLDLGRPSDSIGYARRIITWCGERAEWFVRRLQAHALLSEGIAYYRLRNFGEAVSLHKQALRLFSEIGDHEQEIGTLTHLAMVYRGLGDYSEGLNCINQALQLFQPESNLLHKSKIFSEAAGIYAMIGETEMSLRLLKQALEIQENIGDMLSQCITYINMCEVEKIRENYDETYAIAQKCLSLSERIDSNRIKIDALYQMASALYHLKNYKESIAVIGRFSDYDVEKVYSEKWVSIMLLLSMTWNALGNYHEAEVALHTALDSARHIGKQPQIGDIHRYAVEFYKANNNIAQAFEHFEQMYAMEKQLRLEETQQHVAALSAEYRLAELREENTKLKATIARLESEKSQMQKQTTAMALEIARKNVLLGKVKTSAPAIHHDHIVETEVRNSEQPLISQQETQRGWDEFRKQFDFLLPDFSIKLLNHCNTLTRTEQKICALLRANLSSKDIADTLHVTPHNIDIHRARIRKKLGLSAGDSLTTFLAQI